MYRHYRHVITFLVGIGFSCLLALAPISAGLDLSPAEVPNPRQANGTWVSDTADLLSLESEAQLNRMISGLEAKNGAEIAVVTVEETHSAVSTKAFATQLFNDWGIGKADANNGVLLLVSEGDRRTELEIGYGLKNVITNEQASQLLRDKVTPRFKEGDFDAGILKGTETLISILSGEQAAPVVRAKRDYSWVQPVLMLSGLFGLGLLFNQRGPNDGRNHNNHYYHDNSYSSNYHRSGGSSAGGSDFGGGGSDGGGGGDSW